MGGIYGKILHIDLTSGNVHVEYPPEAVYRRLVGGRALVAYLLLRHLPPNIDPLSPDNLLIFAPGIMQGSNLPGSGRHGVGGKSPLTGAIASSEAGGWWGHEFKRTGYDALVISGRAPAPVYLFIKDQQVSVHTAGHLWGLLTHPAEQAIRQELGDDRVRVAQIGPAGENGVLFASIMHDVNRAAGRNGLGALMGSKNLKAVAVRGTTNLVMADRRPVTETARWFGANYRDMMGWAAEGLGRGTQDSLAHWSYVGGLPTKNFTEPIFENADLLTGERNYEMFLEGRDTCQACPVNCKQVFAHESDNPYQKLRPEYGGPEYEAMAALGPTCLVDDNLAVSKANELCNANGMDAISTGVAIAFVMECFERGILTAADTGGVEFRWGDPGTLVRAVEMIAARAGFGDVMADGVARMSQRFGPLTDEFNMTVKGQEIPMHEPRLKYSVGIGYAVAPVGADHQMNVHDTTYTTDNDSIWRVNSALPPELQIKPMPAQMLNEDKMRLFYLELNFAHFQDCALNCQFYPYNYEQYAELLTGVTGCEYTIADILAVGEGAQTLCRLFNLREGFTSDDDKLPKRIRLAFDSGPIAGHEISDELFHWARRRWYEHMAWDPQTGVPTDYALERLGLDELLAAPTAAL